MRLLLIRHGHTVDSDTLVYAGQRDTPLSALGEQQALALSRRLAGETFAAIFTSDLARARATADHIAVPHGLVARPTAHLREIAMGDWEGKTYAELARDVPESLARWLGEPETVAPPGGETARSVRGRLVHLLDQHAAIYHAETIGWVTHGGVIGVLLCDLLGLPLTRRWLLGCRLASITTITLFAPRYLGGGSGEGSLDCLNETQHLGARP